MTINLNTISSFESQVEHANPEELKKILTSGREIRQLSEKKTHFWNFEQKELNRKFDAIYGKGIERLASSPANLSLIGRINPQMPFSVMAKEAVKMAAIGAGGFAGWLVGWVYTNSMTNLVLHEYGHAWADHQIYNNSNPEVSANAKYWWDHGNYYNWFWGVREGAPGNWTAIPGGDLTEFGKSLTPNERDLFITFMGVGSELAINTSIGLLGLLAFRGRQRVLGASMIGFTIIAHSAAHSYIRRGYGGADPGEMTSGIAQQFGISREAAYQFLWYGYLFAPIVLLSTLAFLLVEQPQEIPDEAVLMRLLTSKTDSRALRKVLAELEIELGPECANIEKLQGDAQGKLLWKVCDKVIARLKSNSETRALFEKTRDEILKEIKGPLALFTKHSFRIRAVAMMAAFVAYEMRSLSKELLPIFQQALNVLSLVFIVAQSICLILDLIQTVIDLANDKLSALLKAISVSRTLLSLVSLIVISVSLFTPGLNAIILKFIIITAAIRIVLFLIQLAETYRLSKQVANNAPPKGVPELVKV